MPKNKNPFTPTFGSIPPIMAGREDIVRDIVRGFDNGPGDPNLATIFMGARGTGKTALLTYLAQEGLAHGWISSNVSAVPGMLEDILERGYEAAASFIDRDAKTRIKGVKFGAVGIDWEYGDRPEGNWRTRMNVLLDELAQYDIGLVITVDEVDVELNEMLQLVSVYQHFVREGRRVALFMAGLPYKVSMLLKDDSISFLRRAQNHQLTRIDDYEISVALKTTVSSAGREIGSAAIERAVDEISGFPYMLQLVGYRSWYATPQSKEISLDDVVLGASQAQSELESRILEMTYRELSEGDLSFLKAMLEDKEESRVADIAKRMGVKSNYASQYKRRLLQNGVIGERGRSMIGFDVPGFRDFLVRKLHR